MVQHYHLSNPAEIIRSSKTLQEVSFCLEKIKCIEQKLSKILTRYEEHVEVYIFQDGGDELFFGEKIVDVFAKLQSDISDIFSEYLLNIQGLKHHVLKTPTELKVMHNIITLTRKQYNKHFFFFKTLKQNLEKSLPTKALEQLQTTTNTLAINMTFITTRQLGLEVLHFVSKYDLDSTVAMGLREVDASCHKELQEFVISIGENWDKHISILTLLVKEQLEKRKMILPNHEILSLEGGNYVQELLIQRCTSILYQILRTLKAKSSDKLFINTKAQLQDLLDEVSKLCVNNKKHYRTYSIISQ